MVYFNGIHLFAIARVQLRFYILLIILRRYRYDFPLFCMIKKRKSKKTSQNEVFASIVLFRYFGLPLSLRRDATAYLRSLRLHFNTTSLFNIMLYVISFDLKMTFTGKICNSKGKLSKIGKLKTCLMLAQLHFVFLKDEGFYLCKS